MRMKLMIGAAMALGLLAVGAPARAAGEYVNVNVGPANPLASGSYNVVLQRTAANTFSVFVKGNPDGRTVPGGVNEPVKHSIGRISIGFRRANGTFITPTLVGSSGASTTGGGFIGAAYATALDGEVVRYNAPAVIHDVDAFGANEFNGIAALSSGEAVDSFTIALQNGTQQWFTIAPAGVVPEPGSLALILPGLAPLGYALMRRRGSRASEAEETDNSDA